MNFLVALRGASLIAVVSVGLGLGFNALSPDPLPLKTVPRTALSLEDLQVSDSRPPSEESASGITVSPEEACRKCPPKYPDGM